MHLKFIGLILALALPASASAALRIVVSVDWEGRNLDPQNLAVMEHFRHDYPKIPLQHFLNAAYYTKPDTDAPITTAAIRSVLRPHDEQGLHIHPWRSLVQAAGVKFRTEPAFRGPMDLSQCDPDCGHDVNMAAYNEKELQKLIRFSIRTLMKHRFERPRSFRAGAWQADNHVFRALVREGITLDSSATSAEYLKERWGHSLLYPVVGKLWPQITSTSQPYTINLGQGLSIKQLPNNGCLADYVTGPVILQTFQNNVELWKKDQKKDIYVSIGFHQETAQKFLPQLRQGIDAILQFSAKENVPVEFVVPPLKL
ncbi:MAG TPA: hypothetical protein VE954_36070 [Oligoflexus sp.]|uniref:hypothetical protein n=1 Tax=Oligoflexus sp. TaxID=1971216 RepID=UPI002D4C13B0|nr:hypothetical protein [Oligoflexus sp.]HYX38551.1 hypothetical protein [Oligoflexus sp.]